MHHFDAKILQRHMVPRAFRRDLAASALEAGGKISRRLTAEAMRDLEELGETTHRNPVEGGSFSGALVAGLAAVWIGLT